jgi:phospholipid transport system substrate-binding protein
MGRVRRWLVLGVVMAAMLTAGTPAWAGAPTEQLKARIDRVLKVLDDSELRQETRAPERRAAIRKVAEETFDFREISQRSLARHWQGRTAAERDEFVRLFTDLLERSYIGQIEQYSGSEKIQYVAETVDAGQALVRTKIATKQGTEVPVDYHMHRADGRWLVYDVSIEGISLVSNYRTQFDRVIRSSSYRQLAEKLRAKKDEGDAAVVKRASSRK